MIEIRRASADATAEVLAIGVGPDGPLFDHIPTTLLPLATRTAMEQLFAEDGVRTAAGSVTDLARPGELPSRILLAGLGTGAADECRDAGAALARAAAAESIAVAVPVTGEPGSALVEGLVLGAHRYSARTAVRDAALATVVLLGPDDADVARGLAFAQAGAWARDLTNTPSNTKTPAWLGEQARRELTPLGVQVEVRDEAWLAEQGFGGVLAVGGGSSSPPRLIEASWRPRGTRAGGHLVLVGKGITFDSGGLNLKPGEGMRSMYTDMGGGAAVLGAVRALAELRIPVRVTALVPAAENAVSGSSMRPSDVIRHYGGRTTEINNPDAEGRLVLADAMAYAVARLRPTALVDIATLTGAMKVALGTRQAGFFATSDELADELVAAGEGTGETLWRMPLIEDYQPMLHSPVADAISAPGAPGAITAAWFLQPFAGDVPWAHVDIAGPARAATDSGVATRGATGFGARLLARWAEARA